MKKILASLLLLTSFAWSDSSSVDHLICKLASANMNTTADQAIPIPIGTGKWVINKIIVTNASTSLTLAVGGFYTAAAKGGTPVVAATQVYSGLTTATGALTVALSAAGSGTAWTGSQLFFSLTTAQGAAATADIYVFVDALP